MELFTELKMAKPPFRMLRIAPMVVFSCEILNFVVFFWCVFGVK